MVQAYLREYRRSDRSMLLNRLTRTLADAAGHGRLLTVTALLEAGVPATINSQDQYSLALILAARGQHSDVVQLLLRRCPAVASPPLIDGCEPYGSTCNETALWAAVFRGDLRTATLLAAHSANQDLYPPSHGAPAICVAAERGDVEMVRLLCTVGAAVDRPRLKDGANALSIACSKGHADVAALLLSSGARPDARTTSGVTPLLLAAYNGHEDVVALLVHNGAEVNITPSSRGRDQGGGRGGGVASPLFAAAQGGHLGVAAFLVEHGADVNAARNLDGATPLHIAAQKGHAAVVSYLVDHGARITPTAISAAVHQGRLEVVSFLAACGSRPKHADLVLATRRGHFQLALYMVESESVPVDDPGSTTTTSPSLRTPLYYAMKKVNNETVQALLRKGARMDVRSAPSSKTLLFLAAKKRNLIGMQLLLKEARRRTKQQTAGKNKEQGVSALLPVDLPDARGRTALWMSCRKGFYEMARLLIELGANVHHRDRKGRSCVDISSVRGHSHVASLVVECAYTAALNTQWQ